ncbi:MAG: hypothetical protein V1735_05405 [Nanoarchaeota archaeon]
MDPVLINEGWRIFLRRLRIGLCGYPSYEGSSDDICAAIVDRCWNGTYFMTSAGHFREFWTRDFGLCIDALLALGHKEKVRSTLAYALDRFSRTRLTTTINPAGKPFDFPTYAPDSLAFLLRSLARLHDRTLVDHHRPFLENEIRRFRETVLDEQGAVRKDREFSSINDHGRRRSSCYDTCMAAIVQRYARELGLDAPCETDYPRLLKQRYWKGDRFISDLGQGLVTGDANVFPAYCGVCSDAMAKKALAAIRLLGLDKPMPLKYHAGRTTRGNAYSWLAPGYERHTVWLHLGFAYLDAVAMHEPHLLKPYLDAYDLFIGKYRNFFEVVDDRLRPYHSLFYACDDSMLWAANFLKLKKLIKHRR